MRRREWAVDAVVASAVTLLVLGPALWSTGYILRGDMVFVPDMPWKAAWLGLDGSSPRAVPMDAVVWAMTAAVPGWLVQRTLLVLPFLVGGLGVGRLLGTQAWGVRAVAIIAFWWNPWVAERLSIGQWTVVAGHALLPWVVLGALRMRSRDRWDLLVATLVLAGVCGPPTMIQSLALALVLVAGGGGGWRRTAVVAAAGTAGALPWLGPGLALSWDAIGSGEPFAAFAVRAESSAGLAASVLSGGGIWKASVWPPERSSAVVVLVSAALSLLALAAARDAPVSPPVRHRLVSMALLSSLLVFLSGTRGGAHALDALADLVPVVTVVRDTHRFLSPLVLAVALGLATFVARAWRAGAIGREWPRIVALGLAVAPVALLPTLGWGLAGHLQASHFPQEWSKVRDLLEGQTGAVAVLPWHGTYRGFEWNGRQAVLDPAPRYFPGDVLIDDRVFLHDGVSLGSEDPRLSRVGEALEDEDADTLRTLGVRWVLAHLHNKPGDWPTGTVVHAGRDLALVDLGPVTRAEHPRVPGQVWAAWLITCLTIVLVMARETRLHLYSPRTH